MLTMSDGSSYEGQFLDGLRHGHGLYTYTNGNRYEGAFENDKRHGQGIYHYEDNERYEGESVEGKREGIGIYHYSDGSRYEGEFSNYKKNGAGVSYEANGERYEGEYRHGKRTGLGILFKPNGTKVVGEFSNGELVGEADVQDISADCFAGRSDEVFSSGPFKSMRFTRLYNSFTRDIEAAIEASRATPTRAAKLREIREFAIERHEGGEEGVAAPPQPAPAKQPVAAPAPTETLSRLEREFKRVRHLKADGGMAEVYLARDNSTGEDVIWKQAAPDRKTTLASVNTAIENESDMLQAIDHPRGPNYIDSGKIINRQEELVSVLVMENIEGTSLDQEMKTMINMGMAQPFDRISSIMLQLCEALEFMADLDPPVFHRDIKPHNIMMTPYRGAVLIDFGLAKGVDAGKSTSLSGGSHTPGWAPPERENGITGPTTDVYSLGQLLWHMLTNERVGIISEEQRLTKMEEMGHPEWLGDLVNYATVPHSPEDRIQSVIEFRLRLENQGELP